MKGSESRRLRLGTVVLVGWLAGCSEGATEAVRSVSLEPCRITGNERLGECGTVDRPADPEVPDGPSISLRVVVFPARDAARKHPLYFFAGGPGQAASEAFGPLLGVFDELGRDRDLVLVDQRGTGSSAPLDCEGPENPTLADQLRGEPDLERLHACLDSYVHDPRLFISTIAATDLDAVRVALGHDEIDLLGGSYGTRAAMVYARAYSAHVGRIVLDGVAPVDMAMPASFGVDAQAALDRTFADCAAQPSCAAAFPDAEAKFERWMDGLAQQPVTADLEDPRTGERVTATLGAFEVGMAVRSVLYSPSLVSVLPLTLSQAQAGDFGPLVAQALVLSDAVGNSFSHGMFLSVVCAEDVPYVDEAAAATSDTTFVRRAVVELFRESCAQWPRAELPAGYREPITLDHPTLVLSGALDPVTPPRWGDHVLAQLPAGRHVIVPGAGHGTMAAPCVAAMIQDFLDGASTLEVGCVDSIVRPPFFIDRAGPPA